MRPTSDLQQVRANDQGSSWKPHGAIPGRFRPDRPARVYLMHHPRLGALKVGVNGWSDDENAESIEADGWLPITAWWFEVGFDALDAEEAVLDRWRNVLSLPPAVRPDQLLQSDAAETAHDTRWTRRDTIDFLDLLSRRAAGASGGEWGFASVTPLASERAVDPWWSTGQDDLAS